MEQPNFAFLGLFSSCYQGFPPEQGKGTLYPIAVPLDQFMKWVWRVDEWELTSASNSNGIETATLPDMFSPQYTFSNVWGTKPANQFPKPAHKAGGQNPENISCFSPTLTLSVSIDVEATLTLIDPTPYKENYETPLVVYIQMNGSYLDGNTVYPRMGFFGWGAGSRVSDKRVDAGVKVSLKLDGIDVPLFVRWTPAWLGFADQPGGSWNVSASTTFVIEPKSYYSYGGTYDTKTGALLKPF